MDKIVASGPVIIENGKLLLIKDNKDDFYKFPGGRVEDGEDFEETCLREAGEEINGNITILRRLTTMYLDEDPKTHKPKEIELHHYLSRLNNKSNLKPGRDVREIRWFDIAEIRQGKYSVAPNIYFLIEKGDIK